MCSTMQIAYESLKGGLKQPMFILKLGVPKCFFKLLN